MGIFLELIQMIIDIALLSIHEIDNAWALIRRSCNHNDENVKMFCVSIVGHYLIEKFSLTVIPSKAELICC